MERAEVEREARRRDLVRREGGYPADADACHTLSAQRVSSAWCANPNPNPNPEQVGRATAAEAGRGVVDRLQLRSELLQAEEEVARLQEQLRRREASLGALASAARDSKIAARRSAALAAARLRGEVEANPNPNPNPDPKPSHNHNPSPSPSPSPSPNPNPNP